MVGYDRISDFWWSPIVFIFLKIWFKIFPGKKPKLGRPKGSKDRSPRRPKTKPDEFKHIHEL